jgi:hypothetical protein
MPISSYVDDASASAEVSPITATTSSPVSTCRSASSASSSRLPGAWRSQL